MSEDKLDNKMQQGLQARLDRIWEDEVELQMQRQEVERELTTIQTVRSDEEFKWLKAQHFALGKALGALAQRRRTIMTVLDNPNAFDKDKADTSDHSSDTAEVIERLKKEDSDLTCKLEKLDAFLNDDNKTAKINEYQLDLMKHQYKLMVEYRRTLINRIFDVHVHQHKGDNNND